MVGNKISSRCEIEAGIVLIKIRETTDREIVAS